MTTLKKWDPFREMEESIDWTPLRDRLFGWTERPEKELMTAVDWSPAIDISEDDKEFLIKAELPEVKKTDIKVIAKDNVLSITGERKKEKEETTKKYHRIERAFGSFERTFTLPDGTDAGKIASTYKDGLLTVHVPKAPEVQPKTTEVKIA